MPTIRTSEEARALIAKRWAQPRPAPVDKRVRTLPSGSRLEERYIAKAEELGLVPEGMSRNALRRLAKRLADDDTARRIRRIHEAKPADLDDDGDLLLSHLAAEAARWKSRAERDRQIALAHEKLADRAESELTREMFKRGLLS